MSAMRWKVLVLPVVLIVAACGSAPAGLMNQVANRTTKTTECSSIG